MKLYQVTIKGREAAVLSYVPASPCIDTVLLLVWAENTLEADTLARQALSYNALATYITEIDPLTLDKKSVKTPKEPTRTNICCIPVTDGPYRFHAQTCKHASPTGLPVYIDGKGK